VCGAAESVAFFILDDEYPASFIFNNGSNPCFIELSLERLRGQSHPSHDVMSYVLIDKSRMDYLDASEVDNLEKQGFRILGMDLVHAEEGSIIDEKSRYPPTCPDRNL
jgi:hypothetical protein